MSTNHIDTIKLLKQLAKDIDFRFFLQWSKDHGSFVSIYL